MHFHDIDVRTIEADTREQFEKELGAFLNSIDPFVKKAEVHFSTCGAGGRIHYTALVVINRD